MPTKFKGGTNEAKKILNFFIDNHLNHYADDRNQPQLNTISNLSPYLHFGQISSLEIALKILESAASKEQKDVFLEELIVRRELSMNFCEFNKNYDKLEGLPNWCQQTLQKHAQDKRPFIYTKEQFEKAQTHDQIWNAAQNEMVQTGKMHGYMRMYWGKKILEWSKNPSQAYQTALYLNNKYELDGRDPNGFTGVAWCFGKHDRPWGPERPIFGLVRFMAESGIKKKIDWQNYVSKWTTL